MINKQRYFIIIFIFYFGFIIGLLICGYFKIGLLSDDYYNLYDSISSSISQKLLGQLPYTNSLHLRPVYYLSLQIGYLIHNFIGLNYDNFINFRIENLLLFLIFSFILGKLIFGLTKNYSLSLLGVCSVLLFPGNTHSICWTAGRVDIICGLLYLLYISFTIDYIRYKKVSMFVLSSLCLISALLTKETAITALPICIIFVYFFKGKQILIDNIKIFIVYFLLFLIYLFFKYFIGQLSSVNLSKENSYIVFVQTLTGLILPIDTLLIQRQIRNNDISILIYFTSFIGFSFILFLYFFQTKFFKILLFLILCVLIIIIPYVFAGYFRQQLILIPFAVILVFIISSSSINTENNKFKFTKSLLSTYIILLLIWSYYSYKNLSSWVDSYKDAKNYVQNIMNSDLKTDKYTILLGSPGRIDQVFLFDKITGAYNYWKYKAPVVKDTIYDIVLIGGLSSESLNSKLVIIRINSNKFEIVTSNEDQFFYVEGFEINSHKNQFDNNYIQIEFSDFNYLKKPRKMNVFLKKKDLNCYVANQYQIQKIY